MKYDYRKTSAGKRRFGHPHIYRLTCLIQRFLWNRGIAVHNAFSDECTPDFNCCTDIGRPARIKVTQKRAKNAVEGDLQTEQRL